MCGRSVVAHRCGGFEVFSLGKVLHQNVVDKSALSTSNVDSLEHDNKSKRAAKMTR